MRNLFLFALVPLSCCLWPGSCLYEGYGDTQQRQPHIERTDSTPLDNYNEESRRILLQNENATREELQRNVVNFKEIVEEIDKLQMSLRQTNSKHGVVSILTGISWRMSSLGYVMGHITVGLTTLSIILALTGKDTFWRAIESPEMQFMREKFKQLESLLGGLAEGIEDLKVVVEKNSARVSVLPKVETIENLYDKLRAILNNPNATQRRRMDQNFLILYEHHYEESGLNLWNSFAAPWGGRLSLKFDILSLYRDDSNCEPQILMTVCITVQNILLQAIMVESYYLSYQNDQDSIQGHPELWSSRMQSLRARCENMTQDCSLNFNKFTAKSISKLIRHMATSWIEGRKENVQIIGEYLRDRLERWDFLVIAHRASTKDAYLASLPPDFKHMEFRNENNNEVDVHVFARKKIVRGHRIRHKKLESIQLYLKSKIISMSALKILRSSRKDGRNELLEELREKFPFAVIYLSNKEWRPEYWNTTNLSRRFDICYKGLVNDCVAVFSFV